LINEINCLKRVISHYVMLGPWFCSTIH